MRSFKQFTSGILSLAFCGLLSSNQALSQRDPSAETPKKPTLKPSGIVIDGDIVVAGTGCSDLKSGSVSKNGDLFWVTLDETIKTELPAGDSLKRSACNISADIVVPADWQYRVVSLFSWYEGQLLDQVQAEIYKKAGIQGKGLASAPTKIINGAGNKNGFHQGVFADDSPWSPCGGGRNVNIMYSQILKVATTSAVGSSAAGESIFETWSTLVARLEWRKC
ncbi:MAG: DUF4360 domain-containing protein [Oligoflexales bacterium]|nr:DUF4360 domain-containing protein [Oligoflexales bacterium]